MNIRKRAVINVFKEKAEFIVLGLTGQKGSGCSTVCSLLQKSFRDLSMENVYPNEKNDLEDNNHIRDKRILYRYALKNWEQFDAIKVRDVIMTFILESWDEFEYKNYCEVEDFSTNVKNNLDDFMFKIKERQIEYNKKKRKTDTNQRIDNNEKLENSDVINVKEDIELIAVQKNRNVKIHRLEWDIELIEYLQEFINSCNKQPNNLIALIKEYNEIFLRTWCSDTGIALNDDDFKKSYVYVHTILPIFSKEVHKSGNNGSNAGFTQKFQMYGNRIRFQGNTKNPDFININPQEHIYDIAKRINSFIKVLRHPISKNNHTEVRVVIDSLKNFYEGLYLRSRYSAFYLISVTRDDDKRRIGLEKRLSLDEIRITDFNERPNLARKEFEIFKEYILNTVNEISIFTDVFKKDEITTDDINKYKSDIVLIDQYFKENKDQGKCSLSENTLKVCKEVLKDEIRVYCYINKLHQFFLQDIESCIQDSDIFLANNEKTAGKENLKYSILKYVILMMHPGLVSPTPVEKCMQIAYTAKLNSGCISRQVGAVTTDSSYNILSIGWNDVPCGQVSCNRRNLMDISRYHDITAYSNYEKDKDSSFRPYIDEFDFTDNKLVNEILRGLPASYCFKDAYCEIVGDKNQVHTRAMHGEEKALLICDQKAIQNGYLFTTSSPCELCAKNAKEHRIKVIYYIEPYPGISQSHICDSGDISNRAQYRLFEGAIGRAYTQLFTPVMPYKDELELRGINEFKNI
ncbi:MAG: hypothetical protein QM644_00405 [Mobilitalea sp.]